MTAQTKLRSQLEVATNIAVLVLSAVVFFSVLTSYLKHSPPQKLPAGLRKGDRVAQLPYLEFRNSSRTLLIAMNAGCHFCAESTPFYNHIAEEACRMNAKELHLAALFPNTADEVNQYVQLQKLKMETIPRADLTKIKVAATPTVILLDEEGTVLDFWIGKLSDEDKKNILKALGMES